MADQTAMTVKLSATGNPDFGQFGSIGVKTCRVSIYTFKAASIICRQFLQSENLGSGNWTGGQIYDASGREIAHVSFNGRVWANDGSEIMI